MARVSTRVVINRQALERAVLRVADGFAEAGIRAIESADPPDATPFGQGLVTTGGTLTYVNGKKTAGWAQDGRQPKKPRASRTRDGIVTIIGWGFPGRFQNNGTVHHPPQPFGTANMIAIQDEVPSIVAEQPDHG